MSPQPGINEAHEAWARVPGYLDTAAIGLPPRSAVTRLQRRIDEWTSGRVKPADFDPEVDRCRALISDLVGVGVDSVGIVSQASMGAGVVAASLPEGSLVLCAEEEFTSVLFPFMQDPRLKVVTVPLVEMLEQIDSRVDLVAVSAVQSSDGRIFDLERLATMSGDLGFRTFVDATQACGWLPIEASRFDVTVVHGYKWLCSPRGAGFMTVSASADWLRPIAPNWYAGQDPWSSIYGPPLRLANDARRFDLSPAWFSYSGAVEALDVIASIGVSSANSHSVGLANAFRDRLGLESGNSAIVSIETTAGPALAAEGIHVSARAGRARFSFYVYNDMSDVEHAADVVLAAS